MNYPRYFKSAIDASGCVSNAWNLIQPKYWMYFGIGVLTALMVYFVPCLNIFLFGPITAGFYYVLLSDMRGEPVDLSMMFKGFEKIGSTLAVGLLQSIPGILWQIFSTATDLTRVMLEIGTGALGRDISHLQGGSDIALAGGLTAVYLIMFAVFIVFGIGWSITFVFALMIVIDTELGAIDAIKLSAKAAWGNVGGIIVLAIFTWLLSMVGFLVLCVGFLFVIPVIYGAWAFAYRQVFPDIRGAAPSGPPLPEEYGGSFGQGL